MWFTTQEGVHVNQVHVTSEKSCLIIAVDELLGGKAENYKAHITESIDLLYKIYFLLKVAIIKIANLSWSML